MKWLAQLGLAFVGFLIMFALGLLLMVGSLGIFIVVPFPWNLGVFALFCVGWWRLLKWKPLGTFIKGSGITAYGERLATPAERRSYWSEPVSIWYFVGIPLALVLGAATLPIVHGHFDGVLLKVTGSSAFFALVLGLSVHEAVRIAVGLPAVSFTALETGRGFREDLHYRHPRSHAATIVSLVSTVVLALVSVLVVLVGIQQLLRS